MTYVPFAMTAHGCTAPAHRTARDGDDGHFCTRASDMTTIGQTVSNGDDAPDGHTVSNASPS